MRTPITPRRPAGFTLIELVISAAIGTMILLGAYLCLSASLKSQKMIEPRVDTLQSGRVVLAMMSADLRAACPLDKNYAFLGMHRSMGISDADNLDFATHHYIPVHEHEADFCEVSYFVKSDSASGKLSLWRRRNPALALDPLSGGRNDELAHGLEGVKFEYTDGLDWYTDWGQTNDEKNTGLNAQAQANLQGMPEAVRITLSFAKTSTTQTNAEGDILPEPPLVFQTVVHLELADAGTLPVASGASSSTSTTPNANAPQGTLPDQPEGFPPGEPSE